MQSHERFDNAWYRKFYVHLQFVDIVTVLRVNRRAFFSIVLLLSVIMLMLASSVGGQGITRNTSWATTTQQVTIPIFSQSPVSTTTLTRTGTSTIYSPTTVTLQGSAPGTCHLYDFTYNGSAGDLFQGKWSSNYVINFYIISDSDYANNKWYCGGTHPSYLPVIMQTSYSLNWMAPKSEKLHFIFENYAEGPDVSADRTVSFTLYKIGALSSSSTIYTIVSIMSERTKTLTLSSIYHSTPPSPLLSPENSVTPDLLAAFVVGAILLVLLLTRRGRKSIQAKVTRTRR